MGLVPERLNRRVGWASRAGCRARCDDGAMPRDRFASSFATLALALLAATAPPARAGEAAASAASAPAQVISDIAHWRHPVKDVFAKYRLTLQLVTLEGRHATFRVAFPFDPQTQPNAAMVDALCADLLRANGGWGYSLESLQDGVAFDVSWNRRTRTMQLDSRPL